MTRAELKRNAREKLGGKLFGPNWVNAVLVMARQTHERSSGINSAFCYFLSF